MKFSKIDYEGLGHDVAQLHPTQLFKRDPRKEEKKSANSRNKESGK